MFPMDFLPCTNASEAADSNSEASQKLGDHHISVVHHDFFSIRQNSSLVLYKGVE